ncbi:MAG: TIGR01244 family sulfur transferase [Pseudomonadota bacterium]|mgnify:CR=1 FL=1|jgi:TIGR01244 family protein
MKQITYITPNFAVTGALEPQDFSRLAEFGFKSIISNRPDDEQSGQLSARQEAVLAWRAGLRFRHVPVTVDDLFSDEPVEAMADSLRELDGPIIAHCKTGLRSAILWAAASARMEDVDCVLAALNKTGFRLGHLREELEAQADRKRWLGSSRALDCREAALVAGATATI